MITKEQIQTLKNRINNMLKSEEQFIFISFKNKDGTYYSTAHCYNMNLGRILTHLKEILEKAGKINQEMKED